MENKPVVQLKVYIATQNRRSDSAPTLDPIGGNTSMNDIVVSGEPKEIVYGDANGDGEVDDLDLLRLVQWLNGWPV